MMRVFSSLSRRWTVIGVLLIALALGLVACDEDDNGDTDTATPTAASVSAAGENAADDDDAGEEVEDAGGELEDAAGEVGDAAGEAADAAGEVVDEAQDAVDDVDAPDVDAPDVDAPDVDAPDIDAPDVDVDAPEIDPGDVDVDPGDADIDVDLPEVEDPGDADIDVDLPEVDVDVDVDTEPGDVDIDSEPAEIDPGSVDVDADAPEVDVDAPEVEDPGDIDVEPGDVDAPDVDVDAPDVDTDVDAPEVDVDLPEVDVEVETEPGDVAVDEGELDVDVDPGSVDVEDPDDTADPADDVMLTYWLPDDDSLIEVDDQFVNDDQIVVRAVESPAAGWLVVHADDDGSPGAVLGYAQLAPGLNEDVTVTLDDPDNVTDRLWLMVHDDTGAVGEYEFGSVEGADAPAVVDGSIVVEPVWTVPHMRVQPQILMYGSNLPEDIATTQVSPVLTVDSVLSEGPGWLVVHADDGDGNPGPVIGHADLDDGLNTDIQVVLEINAVTPTVWPMLHTDSGEAGVYEFGEVEGADAPVMREGAPLVIAVPAAPALSDHANLTDDDTVTLDWALIDVAGWLVIHADDGDGNPGDVIGFTRLEPGLTQHVSVALAEGDVTDTLFPMLHYDTGAMGEYEFGTVEGADGPVRVAGDVVVHPVTPDTDAG